MSNLLFVVSPQQGVHCVHFGGIRLLRYVSQLVFILRQPPEGDPLAPHSQQI